MFPRRTAAAVPGATPFQPRHEDSTRWEEVRARTHERELQIQAGGQGTVGGGGWPDGESWACWPRDRSQDPSFLLFAGLGTPAGGGMEPTSPHVHHPDDRPQTQSANCQLHTAQPPCVRGRRSCFRCFPHFPACCSCGTPTQHLTFNSSPDERTAFIWKLLGTATVITISANTQIRSPARGSADHGHV